MKTVLSKHKYIPIPRAGGWEKQVNKDLRRNSQQDVPTTAQRRLNKQLHTRRQDAIAQKQRGELSR